MKLLCTNVVFLLFFGASSAFAAGAPEGGTWWETWNLQVYHAINLILFIFLIVKLAGPPVVEALKARSDTVGAEIIEANRLHEEAQSMLSEYDGRLSALEAEAKGILDEYRKMGQQERDRIIKQAEVEAQRIRTESVKVAESEFSRARERIEAEVVDRAIDSAAEVIIERLSEAEHARLTSDYFVELEASLESTTEAGA